MLLAESNAGSSLMVTVSISARWTGWPAASAAPMAGAVLSTASDRPRKRKGSPMRSPAGGATTRCAHGGSGSAPSCRRRVSSTGTHSRSDRRRSCSPGTDAHASSVSSPTSSCCSHSTFEPYTPSLAASYRQTRISECASLGAQLSSPLRKPAEEAAAGAIRRPSASSAAGSCTPSSNCGRSARPPPSLAVERGVPSPPPTGVLGSAPAGDGSHSPSKKAGPTPSSHATCGSSPRAIESRERSSSDSAAAKRREPSVPMGAGCTASHVARTSSCSRNLPLRYPVNLRSMWPYAPAWSSLASSPCANHSLAHDSTSCHSRAWERVSSSTEYPSRLSCRANAAPLLE
eukprot:scaffold20325_cov130-Isochrysis_galbana.AAC.6